MWFTIEYLITPRYIERFRISSIIKPMSDLVFRPLEKSRCGIYTTSISKRFRKHRLLHNRLRTSIDYILILFETGESPLHCYNLHLIITRFNDCRLICGKNFPSLRFIAVIHSQLINPLYFSIIVGLKSKSSTHNNNSLTILRQDHKHTLYNKQNHLGASALVLHFLYPQSYAN
ncbi:hypothetical protein FD03_GL000408 [Companilactobacillus nodensis DSM 19682 = JCM 14932 = NBRC 107160]|uniref:Uncharacterized protein n=1 Tax=Companilactobacillus nodensis DSM 19682 = JCM 14932 = NBRC 107160 TaxID=1423775 RepID=A0A0R1K8D1_9LACO|nr:hypothetical protein FD03_GL000408 [Companilactobacillus nodensis DSM 19682 = JCM 14932 = NBRC 107160]